MLVLTRRVGEEIVIDGQIRIRVVELSRSKVRIGVEAPHSTRVDRQEVHDRKKGNSPPSAIKNGDAGRLAIGANCPATGNPL